MKKMFSFKQQLYSIAVLAIFLYSSYNNNQQIYGHNFAGDESASFLALMDQMQTEMMLINTNVNINNQSLAQDHLNEIKKLYTETIKKEIAERNERIANEISSIINDTSIAIGQEKNNTQDFSESVKNFNDVIEEAISVRIDQDALTNSTVHALHFANLINSIDVSYATAVGTEPMNMSAMNMGTADNSMSHSNQNNNSSTNMSSMDMNHGSSDSSMASSMDMNHGSSDSSMASSMDMNHGSSDSSMASGMSKDTANNSIVNETSTISNTASYQTAKELTNVAIDLFNSTIKQDIPSNATENVNTIVSSVTQLKDMIESKAPYDKVMGVIHGPIQTTMLETFNLPLKNSK
jgi:hypothetical protein